MRHREMGWQEGLLMFGQTKRKGFEEKDDFGKRQERLRIRFLMFCATLIIFGLMTRLLYLQIWEGKRQLLFAQTNHVDLVREVAPRGIIFDKNMQPLVKNILVTNPDGKEEIVREYEYGQAFAPIVGYLSQVRENELGCKDWLCYGLSAVVGRAGVEKLFDSKLRGKDGGRVVEYEASGKEVRSVGDVDSQVGGSVVLSIDSRLQNMAYEALKGRKGAVIALDMQGKVLALVSSPTFDPNWFTLKSEPEKLSKALSDTKEQYFLNRALSGEYPPGSVFKPVIAYAGLMSGAITKDDLIEDTGEIKIDNYRYGNWYFDQYGRKEGKINVIRALARSNDIFFYKLGEKLGIDKIDEWAKKFGIGEPTGIELPAGEVGLLPSALWKERVVGEKWFLGNTYHLSIGQGDLTATPLQIARMALGIVSGRRCNLSILHDSQIACEEIGLSTDAQMIVREGMKQACATGGTAFPFFDFDPPVICKTGTAQHSGQVALANSEVKPHAWIIVGYPAENPAMILLSLIHI